MNDWTVVRTLGTDEEAMLVAGFLDAHGVRAEIESLLFHQEPATFPPLGEVRVMVAAADADRARELLDRLPEPDGADPDGADPDDAAEEDPG